MSVTYIPADVRRAVIERAGRACEYCRIHESDTLMGCHVDHVISEKHGGLTVVENLAYACAFCNRSKGSDVGSFVPPIKNAVFSRFFNPRTDVWSEHFAFDPSDDVTIRALTSVGVVTERIFGFNRAVRVAERERLYAVGRYPPP